MLFRSARVACETCASTGLVHIMGEITTSCYVDFQKGISVLMFLLCAVLCVIIYFTLTQEDDGLTREQRKAEKARIKAAKAAAKHH